MEEGSLEEVKMFSTRQVVRSAGLKMRFIAGPVRTRGAYRRLINSTAYLQAEKKPEGASARTDSSIKIEYPQYDQIPQQKQTTGQSGPARKPTLPSFSLAGRTAVVTGGARGLGLVMAKSLILSGADVALVDLNKEGASQSASQLLSDYQQENPDSDRTPKITAHYADVANEDSVNGCLADILQQHGKIDHLVTSAGFTENFPAVSYPLSRIRALWGVNVDGTYLFATGVARHLMSRNAPGSMVFIASMSGLIVNVPQPQAPYNASKAAVRHLASSFAVEWAQNNIRVNVISPGYMMTDL